MKDIQLLRYGKQMLVPQFGIDAQQKLLASRVLVVGVGGLGCPACLYLATAGVGTLILADDDDVTLDNLYRQVLYPEDTVGCSKTEAAAATLRARNPGLELKLVDTRMQGDNLDQYVSQVDAVVDGSDNFATRIAINRSCYAHRKPLVSAAAIRAEGQVAVFDFRDGCGPCYRCLYPVIRENPRHCSDEGVIGVVVGLVGLTQALETIKLLSEYGQVSTGKLMVLDGASTTWRTFALSRESDCAVCGEATAVGVQTPGSEGTS